MMATGFIAAGGSAWMSALMAFFGSGAAFVGFAAGAGAALVLGVAGVVMLIKRIRTRRRINREIRRLSYTSVHG